MKIFYLLLFCGFTLAPVQADELTLYVLPSPKGNDWSTPKSLLVSSLKNTLGFEHRFLGHVYVEFQCGKTNALTSMVTEPDYIKQLLWENRGLGVFFHGFQGRLENGKELRPEIDSLLKEGKLTFIRFSINEGHCTRLATYLKEFQKNNVARHYGLAQRPLFGEGASSASYGVSFLEVAGLLDQDFKSNWQLTVNIPLKYAGPPVTDEGVSLFKLFFATEWAQENESHKKLTFWDPERMHKWMSAQIKTPTAEMKVIKLGNTQGILFDRTLKPAPEGPIWLQHTDPIYQKK